MPSPNDKYKNENKSQERDSTSFVRNAGNDSAKTKSNLIKIPSITLPRSGGATKSINEKFSVNAANGTAAYNIPLPFSPGRGGSTPALTLSYNSRRRKQHFWFGLER